jgi:hypothetical protein
MAAQIGTAFAAPLGATAYDRWGNRVAGAALALIAPTTGATCALANPNATADAQGHFSVAVTAGSVAGTYTVQVTPAGAGTPSAAFILSNLVGAPRTLVVDAGSPAQTTVGTAFPAPWAVRLRDAHGTVVPNEAVSFEVPSSGASASLSAQVVHTDGAGKARRPRSSPAP